MSMFGRDRSSLSGRRRSSGRSPFAKGVVAGIVLVFAATVLINRTPLADWIVAPLLTSESMESAQVIVVLGAGVIGDCVPNHNAVRRVLLAARLWRERRAPLLLFTGGSGSPCPVAESMAAMARDIGVPQDRIRLETQSRSTRENGELSAPLLRGWGLTNVLIVTDRLHMRRAAGVFTQLGFQVRQAAVPIYEGAQDNVSMLQSGLREYVALAYYRLRGWVGPAPERPAEAMSPPTRHMPTAGNATGPVVILGASYALGWNLNEVAGVPVVNKSVTGQQSFELLERFDQDVVAARPRAVILWGFINDIFRAAPGGMDQTLARVRESYTEMVARAKANGIEPILATEVTARPPGHPLFVAFAGVLGAVRGKLSYQDQVNQHVMTVNRWLVELARREGVLILDFQSAISEEGGRRRLPFAQADGSHITTAGYDVLTTYARPILEEHFVVR